MRLRGCLLNLLFVALLFVAFGASSFFWFRYFVRGRSIQAPALIGRSLAEARAVASDAGLALEVDNARDRNADNIAVGAIAWQNRPAGSYVKRGTRIIVGQSLGPLILEVPDLTGESPRTALLRFGQRNLKPGDISYVPRQGPAGIIAEEPPPGTTVDGGTAVSLLVAYPPPPRRYVMPDLIDRSIDQVRPALEARGLTISNLRYEAYPGIRDGVIIRQFPVGGSPVSSRDAVALVVTRQESIEAFQTPGVEP